MLIQVVPAPSPPPRVDAPLLAEFRALLEELPEGDRVLALKFCYALVEARERQRRQRSEWLKRCPIPELQENGYPKSGTYRKKDGGEKPDL